MRKHLVVVTVCGCVSIASAAPASAPAAFAVIDQITAVPDDAESESIESIVRDRDAVIEAAVLGCFVPTEHVTAHLNLAIARDGKVASVAIDLPRGAECVNRALSAIRFAPLAVPNVTAALTVQLDPGPSGCERVWRLGASARLCARGQIVEQVNPSGIVRQMPRTRVLDATANALVMTGLCGNAQLAEYGEHALCVVEDGSASIVFVGMDVEARLGAVQLADGQLLVANGQTIGVFGPTNKRSGGPWDTDVQKLLVEDGLKPANSCTWTVRERLHRAASNGALRMTFDSCAHEPVAVEVTVDPEAQEHAFRMRRLAR